jgi:cytochrome P450
VDSNSGVLSVFRYDDVQRVLSDYEAFSSERGPRDASAASALSASLISSDPPRHRQLRNLVTQAFTPRAIAQLAPRITAILDELLDSITAIPGGSGGSDGIGRMDFIEDLAGPLPVIVIAEMLGIPPSERVQFKRWSDAIVSTSASPTDGGLTFMSAQQEMARYFSRLIAERRAEPHDDLISHLIAAEIEGQHLSAIELIGFCVLLLVAGNETTTNLLGNAILCFDEQPEAYERLRAQPALIPSAIEEVLRYRSPVQSMFRAATGETELGGVRTSPSQPVIAWIGSANRDESRFPDAHHFDIERAPNRHLAFGYGIHFCLGAALARLEARLALEALIARFRAIRCIPDTPLRWMESSIVYGVQNLPITVTLT